MRLFMTVLFIISKTKIRPEKKTVFLTIPSHFAGVSLFGFLVFATLLTGDGDVGSGFGTFALGLGDNENAEHYNFWYLFRYNYMHYVF